MRLWRLRCAVLPSVSLVFAPSISLALTHCSAQSQYIFQQRIKFKKIKSNRCQCEGESSWPIKVLSSKSWIICFELLHCYQKGRQRPVWGGIWSVCPKTWAGRLQPRGTMGKEWRLTGGGSWGCVWLTAISYVWTLRLLLFRGAECWLSRTSVCSPTFL